MPCLHAGLVRVFVSMTCIMCNLKVAYSPLVCVVPYCLLIADGTRLEEGQIELPLCAGVG